MSSVLYKLFEWINECNYIITVMQKKIYFPYLTLHRASSPYPNEVNCCFFHRYVLYVVRRVVPHKKRHNTKLHHSTSLDAQQHQRPFSIH